MAGYPSPMLPPEIRAQTEGAAEAQSSMMMQAGQAQGAAPQSGGDPTAQLAAKIGELEKWTSDMKMLLDQIDPPSAALLVPIAQVGQAMQKRAAEIKKRLGGGASPAQPGPMNPAEGPQVRPQ